MRSLIIPVLSLLILMSCSKNSDNTPPDESVEEETVTYPHTMNLVRVSQQGPARIFSNGHEIDDSIYAKQFVQTSVAFFNDNFTPASKVRFDSKDSLAVFFTASPAKYGIHADNSTNWLYNVYPMSDDQLKDSNMVNFTVDSGTGRYHEVLAYRGDSKELKIPVFAFRLQKYDVDAYGDTYPKFGRTGYKYISYNEGFATTLTVMDTFALQEFEMIYK